MTQASEWRGPVGDVWAEEWHRTERAFAPIGGALDTAVRAVAPWHGTALDIGCGAGSTALALAAARPDLQVVGADLSPSLLAIARARATTANPRFLHDDALKVAADHALLDLLISRHGVMFFPDPAAAFATLRQAAAPGAPLVFTCFRPRAENDWSAATDAALGITPPPTAGYVPGPYAFADRAWTQALLTQSGWADVAAVPLDIPWQIGGGDDPVEDALGFLARIGTAARVLADAAPAERECLRERLRTLLRAHCRDGAVTSTAAIWLWTAVAGAHSTEQERA